MTSEPARPESIDTSLVECIVIVVPDPAALASVIGALADLVDGAVIRILEVVAVTRPRGSNEIDVLDLDLLDDGLARALVNVPVAGLLSENDIALAARALLPGSAGLLVLMEDRWAEALSSAALAVGGRIIGGGRVPRARMEVALSGAPSRPNGPGHRLYGRTASTDDERS